MGTLGVQEMIAIFLAFARHVWWKHRGGLAGSAIALGVMAVAAPPALARSTSMPGGFGLAGITERVASCGGTLTVGPTGAGGFAVTARLPAL